MSVLVFSALFALAAAGGSEAARAYTGDEVLEAFSSRTLVVGIEIDRHGARVMAFTAKPRPFLGARPLASPRSYRPHLPGFPDPAGTIEYKADELQLEVALLGNDGKRHTRRVEAGPLCLLHDPETPPHIEGDTIRLHRDSVIVELPELAGFRQLEFAYYEEVAGDRVRLSLGEDRLEAAQFQRAAGEIAYDQLALAVEPAAGEGDVSPPAFPASAQLLWPEDFADPDIYRIFGNAAEGERRINIVIVPDGYTYAEKGLMNSHAEAMVNHFRNKTPYKEHDPFINYTLVYAYSAESGTDQCDCDIVLDTAMGTRFLDAGDDCGGAGNRCLYYGGGCDTNGSDNIVSAELRAPLQDESVVMVNTTRYGGCGGSRAVYSAGSSLATEIAVHELGHSLGGLADEYAGNDSCGGGGGTVNTSTHANDGAWPEWIAELGAPREGARYYDQCIYRPLDDCEMRSLNQPFCPVCNQHWSLVTFGHPRVQSTAPLESTSPEAVYSTAVGIETEFSLTTRFSTGAGVTNSLTWTLLEPGAGQAVEIGSGVTSMALSFDQPGEYQLICEVVADTNFVKPEKYGHNLDFALWIIDVSSVVAPTEISGPTSMDPLLFLDGTTLAWEDASESGVESYNLYRGDLRDLSGGEYGGCLVAGITQNGASDAGQPVGGSGWFYLVAGENAVAEGPLGQDSAGNPRQSSAPCN